MQWVIIIFFVAFIYLIANWLYNKYAKYVVKERILYGTSYTSEDVYTDLTSGDYGLTGSTLMFYHLTEFLSTSKGYLLLFLGGALTTGLFSFIAGWMIKTHLVTAIFGGFITLSLATFSLIKRKKRRLRLIKDELPNALQLIAAIMESGMGFEASLSHVIAESDNSHPLYFELAIMNEAMQRGRRRQEALKLWAQRSGEDTVIEAVSGLVQAEQTGASFGSVLKHHAHKLMQENESEMLRNAEKLPIKMLIPMVLCTLIPLLLVSAGPAIITIFKMFKDIMGKA